MQDYFGLWANIQGKCNHYLARDATSLFGMNPETNKVAFYQQRTGFMNV